MSRPLSAFAARKATTNPSEEVGKEQSTLEQTPQVSVPHYSAQTPPAKKQKTRVEQEEDQVPNLGSPSERNSIDIPESENSADDIQDEAHSDQENGRVRPVYDSDFERDE
ncbi:MAG: hypothetical protein Q9191_002844 [Dirinaria sp. TL-2023a]